MINIHARKAAKAVRAWRGRYPRDPGDFSDLLADLMHYACAKGIDFKEELRLATANYDAEWKEKPRKRLSRLAYLTRERDGYVIGDPVTGEETPDPAAWARMYPGESAELEKLERKDHAKRKKKAKA